MTCEPSNLSLAWTVHLLQPRTNDDMNKEFEDCPLSVIIVIKLIIIIEMVNVHL